MTRPIRTLLIANRGEIAVRVARTARAMGITTVAVHSDPDADALHVTVADRAVHLPGSTPAETYLDAERILAAAEAAGADAIHPGYGFLSENADFARACAKRDITFVGPLPETIEAMGSKTAAKELMAAAGVPVLPGATVGPDDDVDALGATVGFPLLVKAAFGGGGRGMRIVRDPAELADAVTAAQREAAAAFGDGTVFLERYVNDPRHIEVQVFGDAHGNVVHLFERECSIQRRYQKVIEEAPSPSVDEARRQALGTAAVDAARALGYLGAGTVEFVADDHDFWFLEVNTRLQVEHPVTELITGLDLVRLQLLVAQGQALPPEALTPTIEGHAIEARLYAEDVEAGFLPVSGTLDRIRVDGLDGAAALATSTTVRDQRGGVRLDTGYVDGATVSTFYDAMLAKVIVWAPTRHEATLRLADALAGAEVHGVSTNRELLVGVLRHDEFAAGATDTGFLERHDPAALARSTRDPRSRPVHAVAAALAAQAARRQAATALASLPSGWRNVRAGDERTAYADEDGDLAVAYRATRSGRFVVAVDDAEVPGLVVERAAPDEVTVALDGVQIRVRVHQVGLVAYCDSPLGSSRLVEHERFPLPTAAVDPGSLLAPMPGAVTRIMVAEGDAVAEGTPIVAIEAMKMEHVIRAPHDGTVASLPVPEGAQVDTGTVLAVVEASDGDGAATDPAGAGAGSGGGASAAAGADSEVAGRG